MPLTTALVVAGVAWLAPLAGQDSVPRPVPAGRPVVVDGDTVLQLHAAAPPFTLEQRALAASSVLADAAHRRDLRLDRLTVRPGAGRTLILADSVALLTVLDGDAAAEGVPRDTLAARWARALETSFAQRPSKVPARALLLGLAQALLATLVFAVLLWLLQRVENRTERWMERWAAARLQAMDRERARLITPAMVANTTTTVTRLLRQGAFLLLGYLWLVAVFGAFPLTRPLAGRILRFITDPVVNITHRLVEYLPSLFFIVVVVAVLRVVLRVVRAIFRSIEQGPLVFRRFPPEWADPTYKIVRALIVAFGLIMIFPYLPGAGSEAFNGISLFVGALFSLGSTGAVANIVAGTVIVYTRAFRVGDFVRIGETEGMVLERSLLVTRIRTATNVDVSIPSSTVLGAHVQNFSAMIRQGGLVVQSRVTIGYDAPWRRVHDLLVEGARRTDGVLTAPAPFVVQEALNDYYPTYCLNAYTDRATAMEVFRLRSRLNENIQDAFFEGGVEILSPAFTAVRDGNRTAMPPQYLPPDYRAPGFRVERDGESA